MKHLSHVWCSFPDGRWCIRTGRRLASVAVLFWSSSVWAGGGKASSVFRQFCEELRIAERVFANGPDGKQQLEECLFLAKKPLEQCSQVLGVDSSTIRYIRKNSDKFAVTGDVLSGFALLVSDQRLSQIQKIAPKSGYADIIAERLKVQKLVHDLGTHGGPGAQARQLAEGEDLSQPQKDLPQVTTSMLVESQKRYLELLEEQLKKERDQRICDCLSAELKTFAKLGNGP